MYRQWHSIERVWDLMEGYEWGQNIKYDYVGMLRNDVKYRSPIPNISANATRTAVIPNFQRIMNDRMFLGTRQNAKVWSKTRFPAIANDCYKPKRQVFGLHSSYFVKDFIMKRIGQDDIIKDKDICFYRINADGGLRASDCWS